MSRDRRLLIYTLGCSALEELRSEHRPVDPEMRRNLTDDGCKRLPGGLRGQGRSDDVRRRVASSGACGFPSRASQRIRTGEGRSRARGLRGPAATSRVTQR